MLLSQRRFCEFRGQRCLNLSSILEVVEYKSSICVFHKKRASKELRLKQKLVLLLKKHVFSLNSTTFAKNLPTWWQLGGTFPP